MRSATACSGKAAVGRRFTGAVCTRLHQISYHFSKIERHFARHMLAWGFGEFKGGEIFLWRNYPLRNCPRAKSPPPPCKCIFILYAKPGSTSRRTLCLR